MPEKYATLEGRKVAEESAKLGDLLRNPNKFFFIIIAAVVIVLALIVLIIWLLVKLIKLIIKRVTKS